MIKSFEAPILVWEIRTCAVMLLRVRTVQETHQHNTCRSTESVSRACDSPTQHASTLQNIENIVELRIFRRAYIISGGGKNLERPIFRNFKIANIKITKDELFVIFEFNISFFRNHLNTQNILYFFLFTNR